MRKEFGYLPFDERKVLLRRGRGEMGPLMKPFIKGGRSVLTALKRTKVPLY
jgi:hypothetical protein